MEFGVDLIFLRPKSLKLDRLRLSVTLADIRRRWRAGWTMHMDLGKLAGKMQSCGCHAFDAGHLRRFSDQPNNSSFRSYALVH